MEKALEPTVRAVGRQQASYQPAAAAQRHSSFIPLETDESGRAQAAKLTVQFIA